jgi:hypothetical protein
MLPFLQASPLIAAGGRYDAEGSLYIDSSDEIWREEQSAVAHMEGAIVVGGHR